MNKVKVIILRTAGTNCDRETEFAFLKVGADVELVHINELKNKLKRLSDYHILALPGGFTYGDDIASGKILANEIKYAIRDDVEKFIIDGKLIIGICNGFQVLVKMGLLPALDNKLWSIDTTLTLNDSAKFEDRWCYIKQAADTICIWTRDLPEIMYLPVAHAEGKFIPRDESLLSKLKESGQVVFRYADSSGYSTAYPGNPNGSRDDIAGICDATGRVLGLMPHPERHIFSTQHPRWTREAAATESGDGLNIFSNGVQYVTKNILQR